MIILEGPDGSGKTTLLNMLTHDLELPIHERFSTSTGGPIVNIFDAGRQDLLTWDDQPMSLYDRHPMISEPIYGSVLRGNYDERFRKNRISSDLFMGRGLVVFCMPPLDVARRNILVEDQLSGVVYHYDKLYAAYASRAASYSQRAFFYNYTTPNAYPQLVNACKRYLEEGTHARKDA